MLVVAFANDICNVLIATNFFGRQRWQCLCNSMCSWWHIIIVQVVFAAITFLQQLWLLLYQRVLPLLSLAWKFSSFFKQTLDWCCRWMSWYNELHYMGHIAHQLRFFVFVLVVFFWPIEFASLEVIFSFGAETRQPQQKGMSWHDEPHLMSRLVVWVS